MDSTALLLMGGGSRAAYQAGVLRGIARLARECAPDAVGSPFDVICGTSAGAINGVGLARGAQDFLQATEALVQLWAKLHADRVYRTDVGRVGASGARWLTALAFGWMTGRTPRALFDNTPLRELLLEQHDAQQLQAAFDAGAARAGGHGPQLHHGAPCHVLSVAACRAAVAALAADRRDRHDRRAAPAGLVEHPFPVSRRARAARGQRRMVRRRHDAADVAAVARHPPGCEPHPRGGGGLAPAAGVVRHGAGIGLPVAGAGGGAGAGERVPRRAVGRHRAAAARQRHGQPQPRDRRCARRMAQDRSAGDVAVRAHRADRRPPCAAAARHRARAAQAAGRHRGARRGLRQLSAVRAGVHP
ncbi:hypothetical protein C2U35_19545 [Ralstonia solanacearum]|nr:hypothetical protein C2U35_19545 [Ralstonia solanacearum]